MSSKKSWGLRGLLAAVFAVLVALTALPGMALAAVNNPQTYSFTISGLHPGDTVNLYEVVHYEDYDSTKDVFAWDFITVGTNDLETALGNVGITKEAYNDPNYADVNKAAAVMAKYVADYSVTPADTQTVAAGGNSVTTKELGVGQYLVVVTPSADTSGVIYQYAILNVQPEKDATSGNWDIKAYVKGATTPSTELVMKSDTIPFEKTTIDDGASSASTDDYGVGEDVPFTITTKVPTYSATVTKPVFDVSDAMSAGLDFSGTVSVKLGTNDAVEVTTENFATYNWIKSYEVTADGFELSFNYANLTPGADVVITYTAEVTAEAVQGTADRNDATLEYNNGPQVNTAEDSVDVYTFAVNIEKIDASDNRVKLEGAVFGVYTTEAAAQAGTADDPDAGGTEFYVGSIQGVGELLDLGEGTYYVKELTAPNGYQLDETVFSFNVNDTNTSEVVNYVYTTTITNSMTPNLPVTGGEGTIAITATGVVLIAGAAALIVRARRQRNN